MIHIPKNQIKLNEEILDCNRILLELNQQFIEEDKKRDLISPQQKIIINNVEKEDEVHSSTVNIIVNKYTKNFVNSSNASDVIQSSLEYNNYLINKMLENSSKLSQSEYDYCANILWKNLKKLSKSADQHIKSSSLIKNCEYSMLYSKYKLKESNRHKNYSGLVITIDKSILEEFPENLNLNKSVCH